MKSPPSEGEGLHDWLLATSKQMLIEKGIGAKEEVKQCLLRALQKVSRTTQDIRTEIENAVEGAVEWLAKHPNRHSNRITIEKEEKVRVDPSNYYFRDSLANTSNRKPWLPTDVRFKTKVLDSIVPDIDKRSKLFSFPMLWANMDFLICASVRMDRHEIYTLKRWMNIGYYTQQYVVPNYMLTIGRERCDDNIGKELFQVVEFDAGSLGEQWKLLAYLDLALPLAMIVFSGGKSLHGWFPIYALSKQKIINFFRLATKLGADRHLWTPCQYVRMPEGTNRKTSRRQEVLYWNSEVLEEQNEIVRKYSI